MLLALSVVSEQGGTLGPAAYKIFDERGGSIGRVAGNDWVLPDPQNFVSSRHARVSAHAGVFFLEDTSSNGTFINAPDRLAARGEPQQLADGDRLYIGDYEIIVQLIPSAPDEIAPRAAPPTMSDAPTRLQVPARAPAPAVAQAQARPPVDLPPPSALGLGTVDPLAALGAPAPSTANASDPLAALGNVSGGAGASVRSNDPLAARGGAPAGNGASATANDTLAALGGGAPAGPLAALGLDVSQLDPNVQAALSAAVRAGFNALLMKLHPEQLEDLFEKKLKRTAMLGLGNKAKYWEMYRALFEEIDGDRDTHFRQLFGEEFAQVFNDHLQKLAAAARLRGR